jgi:hypothetical protein
LSANRIPLRWDMQQPRSISVDESFRSEMIKGHCPIRFKPNRVSAGLPEIRSPYIRAATPPSAPAIPALHPAAASDCYPL